MVDNQNIQRNCPNATQTRQRYNLVFAGVIVVLGLIAYHNTLSNPFVFDDVRWITNGERIRNDLWPPGPIVRSTLRPVLFFTLAVNYRIGGLNETGYHVFNIAIHLASALTLFGLVRRSLNLPFLRPKYETVAPWLALAVAGIWVVHPLQTQAVNYVIQRGESTMSFCLLLTLYCLVRTADSPRPWLWYIVGVVASTVGMGCKEVMIVAPLIVVLFDRVFLSFSFIELLRRRWIFYLAMAPAWLWLAASAVPGIGVNLGGVGVSAEQVATADVPNEIDSRADESPAAPLSAIKYARSQPGVLLHYLRLVFWPQPLCFDYQWPVATFAESTLPIIVVSVLFTASVAALWFSPPIGFVALSFFILLAPTSSIMPIQDLAVEHRMYLPSATVITLLVLAIHRGLNLLMQHTHWSSAAAEKMFGVLVIAAIASLSVATVTRNKDYQSKVALWESVLQIRENNIRAMQNLAQALIEADQFDLGRRLLLRAEHQAPRHPGIQGVLGELELSVGEDRRRPAAERTVALRRAIDRLNHAIAGWPKKPIFHLNKGVACELLAELAAGQSVQNQSENLARQLLDEAIGNYQKAVRLGPGIASGHKLLGHALFQAGRIDESIEAYSEALRQDPHYFEAHVNIGIALATQRRFELAFQHFVRAIDIRPSNIGVHENLAIAYLNADRIPEAIATAESAALLAESQGNAPLAETIRTNANRWKNRQ